MKKLHEKTIMILSFDNINKENAFDDRLSLIVFDPDFGAIYKVCGPHRSVKKCHGPWTVHGRPICIHVTYLCHSHFGSF